MMIVIDVENRRYYYLEDYLNQRKINNVRYIRFRRRIGMRWREREKKYFLSRNKRPLVISYSHLGILVRFEEARQFFIFF